METYLQLHKKYNFIDQFLKGIGTFYFYEGFIIGEMKEGVNVQLEDFEEILDLGTEIYGSKRFGYISNRVNSYSISPLDHLACKGSFMNNFAGFAVVTYRPLSDTNAAVEEIFVKKPFKRFNDFENAISWIQSLL